MIAITVAWALGVFIGVVVAGPYSGAHLNPAVSIGLALVGKFDWVLVPGYVFFPDHRSHDRFGLSLADVSGSF